MRSLLLRLALALACLGLPGTSWADSVIASPTIELRDEGASQGGIKKLDCVGAGISCSRAGVVGTISVPGGGGSANVVSVTVDFGSTGATVARTVVTGQTWVSTGSVIVCTPTLFASADRIDGAEDAMIEGLTVSAYARVAGTGFTIAASPHAGRAFRKFTLHCTGA